MSNAGALNYTSERVDLRWYDSSETDFLTYLFPVIAYIREVRTYLVAVCGDASVVGRRTGA